MKKILSLAIVTVLAFAATSNAATLSAVYDFRGQLDPSTTSFEGLAFTNDGNLWITSAPNFKTPQLLEVDLNTETVLSTTDYQAGFFDILNPVGLASDGENLFVGSNRKGGWFGDQPDYIYRDVNTSTGALSNAAVLSTNDCVEAEGAAYLNGLVYISCEDTQNVIAVDPTSGAVVNNINLGVSLLGLGATENSLIIGDYTNHALLMYDVASQSVTETIDLFELFPNYQVEVEPGDIRNVPDPDGLAYKDGKIYMTFEHDLQVYEISLDPVATPEPGTLLLLGAGLLGIFGWKRKRP